MLFFHPTALQHLNKNEFRGKNNVLQRTKAYHVKRRKPKHVGLHRPYFDVPLIYERDRNYVNGTSDNA